MGLSIVCGRWGSVGAAAHVWRIDLFEHALQFLRVGQCLPLACMYCGCRAPAPASKSQTMQVLQESPSLEHRAWPLAVCRCGWASGMMLCGHSFQ